MHQQRNDELTYGSSSSNLQKMCKMHGERELYRESAYKRVSQNCMMLALIFVAHQPVEWGA